MTSGSNVEYNKAIETAVHSGCWMNLVDKDDAMAVQPWLKGVAASHIVADPEMLNLATLHPG